jgi:hypothetical protein
LHAHGCTVTAPRGCQRKALQSNNRQNPDCRSLVPMHTLDVLYVCVRSSTS